MTLYKDYQDMIVRNWAQSVEVLESSVAIQLTFSDHISGYLGSTSISGFFGCSIFSFN